MKNIVNYKNKDGNQGKNRLVLSLFNFKGKGEEKPDEKAEILKSIKEIKDQINYTYTLFNMTDDDNLTESYIHEINALNSRYSYLLNQFKKAENIGEKL